MVNKILNAVTKQLGTTFGKSYHYYVEDVEQGLTKPCFTVDVLIPLQRAKSPVLYDRTMPVVIHYFSDSETNLKNDCYSMAERVMECLEYLPYQNSLLRGGDVSWQIVDDVLQVFVTYKFTTKKVTADEDYIESFVGTINLISPNYRETSKLDTPVIELVTQVTSKLDTPVIYLSTEDNSDTNVGTSAVLGVAVLGRAILGKTQ